MKIKRVEIKNFRGIEHLELDFVDPAGESLDLVVLAGPNGCGKTSVLEACILACNHSELPQTSSSPKFNLLNGCNSFEISLNVDDKGMFYNVTFFYEVDGKHHDVKRKSYGIGICYFSSRRYSIPTGSIGLTVHKKAKKAKSIEDQRLFEIKQRLINLTGSAAFTSTKPKVSEQTKKTVYSKINDGWKLFYPNRNCYFNAEYASNKIEDGFDVFLCDIDSAKRLSIDSLSSGELEIFMMLSCFALNDLSNTIVFIDEPELHLHPSWHRTIMNALKTVLPKTQIICATHSTEILDSVYSYERFTLLPENDPRIKMYNTPDINKDWK